MHPAERVGKVEKVGGTKNPRVARIVEARAGLGADERGGDLIEDAQALERAGIRVHSTFPKDTDGTAEMVRSIGAALERGAEAERLAREIEARAERVRQAARGLRQVTWAYLIWRQPWMSVNRDTFVDALLALAGGCNVFGDRTQRYPEITLAELAQAAPQRVFLCTEPFSFKPEHADELSAATGLPRERFVIADGEYLSWHGSRTPDGIDYAEGLIRAARC